MIYKTVLVILATHAVGFRRYRWYLSPVAMINIPHNLSDLSLVLITLLVISSLGASAQSSRTSLAQVKRIYIKSFPTSDTQRQIKDIGRELVANGFEVVEEQSQADAVLSWESQVEIVLHGDGTIPDKSIFSWELSSDNKPIWKHRIKFTSKTPDGDWADSVKKLANKLSEDKAKAIKKGASR